VEVIIDQATNVVMQMSNETKSNGQHDPHGIGNQKPANATYTQKLRQAKSWIVQDKLETARVLLSEAKELAILYHLDRAPMVELEAKIALHEVEDEVKQLVDQGRWPEARRLVESFVNKCPSIPQGMRNPRIVCWLEIIGTAEGVKSRPPDPANASRRVGQ
jgi:hypothetical protein